MGKILSKRILGIIGSPRRNGNTEILVDEILAGAEEAGALTEKIILNEIKITPCQACYLCKDDGECVQQDDMAGLLFLGLVPGAIPALIEHNAMIKNASNRKRAISVIVFYLLYCFLLYSHSITF